MKEYSDAKKNKIKNRVMAWVEEFKKDQRYESLNTSQREESGFIIDVFADLMYGYFLLEPSEWTPAALEECCLDLLPRKVSADLSFYTGVEPVLSGFFGFLQAKGYITDAPRLISQLKKVSGKMIEIADNPDKWGPAKQIVMGAKKAGVDFKDSKELDSYVQMFNSMQRENIITLAAKVKIGRNDPCPCGSGKKYKKCCDGKERIVSFPIVGSETSDTENSNNAVTMDAKKSVYQLKVMIRGIKPPIWRQILVPRGITFNKLHKIIQTAFGWQGYHLFEFDFGDVKVCIPEPGYDPELYLGIKELNAKRTKIDSLLTERKKCIYTYDFGDEWKHEVVLEGLIPVQEGIRYPVCTDGARQGPPEDVGGAPGYREFLKIIRNPKHPEHDECLEWVEMQTGDGKFNPEYFSLEEINRLLAKIK
ncbi:MAG: hypothetical protein HPY50_09860 [Firmicutes bacterium]|nr:hypothetical protein [Bacillota bacterium]